MNSLIKKQKITYEATLQLDTKELAQAWLNYAYNKNYKQQLTEKRGLYISSDTFLVYGDNPFQLQEGLTVWSIRRESLVFRGSKEDKVFLEGKDGSNLYLTLDGALFSVAVIQDAVPDDEVVRKSRADTVELLAEIRSQLESAEVIFTQKSSEGLANDIISAVKTNLNAVDDRAKKERKFEEMHKFSSGSIQ